MKLRWIAVLLFPIVAAAQQLTPQSSTPRFLGDLGGYTYFYALDPATGRELWRTDGTPEGTALFIDLIPGATGFLGFNPVGTIGGRLVVAGITSNLLQSLYAIDGAPAGTREIASQHNVRSTGVLYRGALYYINGSRLWRTDGTTAGTVDTGIAGYFPMAIAVMGDSLYMIAVNDAFRLLFLRTDGTPAGTQVLMTVPDDSYYDTAAGATISVLGDRLVFSMFTEKTRQTELWTSDGTAAGTMRIAAFDDTRLAYAPLWVAPASVASARLLFRGVDAVNGAELWITDGTAAGTRMLADLQTRGPFGSFPEVRAVAAGKLFFHAFDAAGSGIWTVDGSTLEVRRLLSFHGLQHRAAAFNGGMVFTVEDISHGAELWWTDGTPEGTRPIVEIYPGPASGAAKQLTTGFAWPLHSTSRGVLFVGNDGVHGDELWITDGTAAGTRMLKNIHTGTVTELDTDGVPALTENGAPNAGDADADGTPDAQSSQIASMRALSRDYVIVKASCPIEQARLLNPSSVTPEAGHPAQDIAEFQLQCTSAQVTITYTGGLLFPGMRYLTYAPIIPGITGWFALDSATITLPTPSLNRMTIQLTLTDGGPGDDSPAGDGVIVHRGVVGVPFSGRRSRAAGK